LTAADFSVVRVKKKSSRVKRQFDLTDWDSLTTVNSSNNMTSTVNIGGSLLTVLLIAILASQRQPQDAPPTPLPAPIVAPAPSAVTPDEGQAPANQPQPGQPGGGALPALAVAPTVLALIPAGLLPVAVFPPFASPRTTPAECVIFSENDEVSVAAARATAIPRRVKRLASFRRWLRRWRRRRPPVASRRHWSWRPRRQRAQLFPAEEALVRRSQYGRVVDRRYGFICRVSVVSGERCALGCTCDECGRRLDGEPACAPIVAGPVRFASCRVEEPRVRPSRFESAASQYGSGGHHSRQAFEEFSSAAPADCRTEFSPPCVPC